MAAIKRHIPCGNDSSQLEETALWCCDPETCRRSVSLKEGQLSQGNLFNL